MIDRKVFSAEWAILSARFEKDFPDAVAARYLEILEAAGLDSASFRESCAMAFRGRFFPSPNELIEAARDRTEDALVQWEMAERIMYGEREMLGRMTEAGRRTVQILGGPSVLGATPVERVSWVRREFLATFKEVVFAPGPGRLAGPEVTPESRRIMGAVIGQIVKS